MTIDNSDGSSVNASSSGVLVNSAASVSFSVGDNSAGLVAKWIDIDPGDDGSFTVTSVWDSGLGSGTDNDKGYSMSAFKLETQADDTVPPATPSLAVDVAGPTSLDVHWDAVANVESYELNLVDGSSNPVYAGTNTSFPATGLTTDVEYCYEIRALNSVNGDSAWSSPPTCGTPVVETAMASFQQGVGGYTGTVDTYLDEGNPGDNYTSNALLRVDLEPDKWQVLLRFEDIIGGGSGQIPFGSTIESATLGINVTNSSTTGAQLYRMIAPWSDSDTWTSRGGGIDTDGVEAESTPDSSSGGSGTGAASVDVTADVQTWSDGAANRGWAWLQSEDNSWQFNSSDTGTVANRPVLTVEYVAPPAPAVATFQQDVADYEGTVDTYLKSNNPGDSYEGAPTLFVDTEEARHALLRFDGIFGDAAGQVPSGATVQYATLTVNVTNEGDGAWLHRMLQDWDDTDSWGDWGGGIQADGVEAALISQSDTPEPGTTGVDTLNVTADVQAWSGGSANHGWALLPPGSNSWQFDSAEDDDPPILTIGYIATTDPTITVSGTPLGAFHSQPTIPSDEQMYTVSGTNLTADIVITAPTDFEVSTTSGSGFDSTVNLTPTGGTVATTDIYVHRLRATEGASGGDISHASAGATTLDVAVTGTTVTPGAYALDLGPDGAYVTFGEPAEARSCRRSRSRRGSSARAMVCPEPQAEEESPRSSP